MVGIPMGTNSAPLVIDLFLFYYERDFMFFAVTVGVSCRVLYSFVSYLYVR